MMNLGFYWLITGVLFLMIEISFISGIGLLFAGLAALIVSGLVIFDSISQDAIIAQFIWFFSLTCLLGVALGMPLKRFQKIKKSDRYNNIIGERAVVMMKDPNNDELWQIRWSGTIMNAKIDDNIVNPQIEVGSHVEIIRFNGNVAIVKPVK